MKKERSDIKSVKKHGVPLTTEGLSNPCLCFRSCGSIALCRYCDGSIYGLKGWIDNAVYAKTYYTDVTHYIEFEIGDMWSAVNQMAMHEDD